MVLRVAKEATPGTSGQDANGESSEADRAAPAGLVEGSGFCRLSIGGFHLKGLLLGELFTLCRNWLAPGRTVPTRWARYRCQSIRNIQIEV